MKLVSIKKIKLQEKIGFFCAFVHPWLGEGAQWLTISMITNIIHDLL